MFWVYILHCSDDSYYTGHTDNLEKRMYQYCAGECEGYVASRRPASLIWSQEFATRHEALSAERQIKGWSRKKKEAMIRGNWSEVSRLAQGKSSVRPELIEGQNAMAVRPELVEGQNAMAVRPELVEGQNAMAVRPELVEGRDNKSLHPSTSLARSTPAGTPPLRGDPSAGSGRTDFSFRLAGAKHE